MKKEIHKILDAVDAGQIKPLEACKQLASLKDKDIKSFGKAIKDYPNMGPVYTLLPIVTEADAKFLSKDELKLNKEYKEWREGK